MEVAVDWTLYYTLADDGRTPIPTDDVLIWALWFEGRGGEMRKVITVVLLSSAILYAQDAKVELLTPDETAVAKSAYDNLEKAKSELEKVKKEIIAKHLSPGQDESYSNCLEIAPAHNRVKSGWGCGEFDFSVDFKAIVPHSDPPSSTYPNGCGWIVPAKAVRR